MLQLKAVEARRSSMSLHLQLLIKYLHGSCLHSYQNEVWGNLAKTVYKIWAVAYGSYHLTISLQQRCNVASRAESQAHDTTAWRCNQSRLDCQHPLPLAALQIEPTQNQPASPGTRYLTRGCWAAHRGLLELFSISCIILGAEMVVRLIDLAI